ncbi:MAG: GldG family protein [Gammaproteobacteria bacterium]|nr:GldG family protein [Gammaproteobacteria bacterium]
MERNTRSRWLLKLQSVVSLLLLAVIVGALAWLSDRYALRFDWTAASRNTLSDPSRQLLETLDHPLTITAYARDNKVIRQAIQDLVNRYRAHKSDIELSFRNPDKAPDEVRRLGITTDGELIVSYNQRTEHVKSINEQSLTNAIHRVARPGQRRVAYLSGHGERDLLGRANHDLGAFSQALEQRGFSILRLDLSDAGAVPDNTDVLVLSEGDIEIFGGELALIQEHLERGGNLLWLGDPARGSMRALAAHLDLELLPGRVIEPVTRTFGVDDPAVVIVSQYGDHEITRNFKLLTVFPGAVAVRTGTPSTWRATPLLKTSGQSWSETGGPTAGASPGDGEARGPLTLGVALSRPRADQSGAPLPDQRVVFIGDGDFLSNAYLGNAGNLDFGLNLFNWLGADDAFIDLPARVAPDLDFNLSRPMSLVVAFVPLAVMPVALLAAGFFVWRRRRRR